MDPDEAAQPAASVADRSQELIAGFATVAGSLTAARHLLEAALDPGTAEARDPEVPVTLLTGFLGSGKTTVVRKLLTGRHLLRISAIVNDLAEINIDAKSLIDSQAASPASSAPSTAAEIARLELSNGCACCQLTDDLIASLTVATSGGDGLDRARPDAVVVEASGVADPVTMAAAVHATPGARLDGIVAVADAEVVRDQLHDPFIGRLARRQLEACHLVMLSKVDLVTPRIAAGATAAIAAVAPGRPVLPAPNGSIDPAVLLSAARRGASLPATAGPGSMQLASDSFAARDIDRAALATWLDSDHGLIRAKGWIADHDRQVHELQVVGRRWSMTPSSGDHDPVLVVIASTDAQVDQARQAITKLVL
jgi:G3E family GTPase